MVKYLSYIDDISLTTSLTSLNRNIKVLEREVERLVDVGQKSAISFDIAKTELIYFTMTKRSKKSLLTLLLGALVAPKPIVK